MLSYRLNPRAGTAVRLAGLALIGWSVLTSSPGPGGEGRSLVVTVLFAAAVIAWLVWTLWSSRRREITPDLYVMAAAGGLLTAASPHSAASAFVFVAVVAAGIRVELAVAVPVVIVGVLALAIGVLVYDTSALGLLAYSLGFAAAQLGGSNARQSVVRAEQAELLLAQSQRSHEEQLRVARLEESTRIAREIHDVLAHALAGLTIQLEATSALLEQGADTDAVLARVRRAHRLAQEGLQETRRAVGALRGEVDPAPAGIEALVAEYRADGQGTAQLTIDGDRGRLAGSTGDVVIRVLQEALTNVRKHAPGADVSVAVHAGVSPQDVVGLVVEDHPRPGQPAAPMSLAASGGGFGVRGMRERAEQLGGRLSAEAAGTGWRVELSLPGPAEPADPVAATEEAR
ncbi:MAG TPA: histidine kinase [Solirubrobacteraceae bacterium]|nr:histidine kinase [Solirubrobacteraceae bacterium]